MATNAPPQTPPELVGEDAFAAVARKLDALLDAREARAHAHAHAHAQSDANEYVEELDDEGATAESADPPVDPVSPSQLIDPLTPLDSGRNTSDTNAAAEIMSMLEGPQHDAPAGEAATLDAATPEAEAKPLPDTLDALLADDQADAQVETPAAAEAGAGEVTHADQASAVAEIDALLSQPPAPVDEAASAGAAPQGASVATGMDIPNNPSSADLDAELEALLAESPIDAEVLNAAEDMAKRDAEEAERNQEALRQRAEEAANAMALAARGEPDEQADEDITAEINGLLAAEEEAAAEEAASDTGDDAPAQDPTIDQIDQMLAEGTDDEDDAIDGAFYSAQDVATDNLVGPGETLPDDATLPGTFDTTDASADDKADEETQAEAEPDKLSLRDKLTRYGKPALRIAGKLALQGCWLLNWPARKFLTTQWRATLGYVALLQAVGALAVWLYLVVL
ncbi:hypothetical protein OT109_07635 [Phycisphaeraceae bacterium D3-23]